MNTQRADNNTRTKILETASRLFYEQGYHLTGINQVIAEAGVAKASFYYHFSSKEDLCIAYLEKRHQDWFGWLREEVERSEEPQERLLSLFTFLERWLSNSDFRGCAFLNITAEFPSPDHRIRQLVVSHKDALQAYIAQLVNRLNIPVIEHNSAYLVSAIYLLFEGTICKCQMYRTTEFIQNTKGLVNQLISVKVKASG
jgi:AcrR family transcriptional regulator